ncbi:MAG TPA: undecaprenyl-diphosphate phosphatase [Spirochaetota bacterium]|nr:undecaprenyl-diphosphate phosphatase [Spirochaetota bacterium]
MGILEGLILGAIQGISEFLPISSSGHLALFGNVILPAHASMDLFTEVLLHLGTLAAVLIVFAREAFPVFLSPFTAIGVWRREGRSGLLSHAPLRLLGLVLLASLPAAVIGLMFEHDIEALVRQPAIVAALLAITGLILLGANWMATHRTGDRDKASPGIGDAILIGLAQAFAILPGISRSGMTISMGLVRAISREMSGVFSFLLFVPAIAGATLLQVLKLLKSAGETSISASLLPDPIFILFGNHTASGFIPAYHISGFLGAFVVGLIALTLLVRLLKAGRFHWFGWYCLAASLFWTLVH